MQYFKKDAILKLKPDIKVFYIEDSGEGAVSYTVDDASNPTDEQIAAELTRLHNAEPMRLLREERDKKLAKCDWRASSDLTIPDAWKTYRQQLRDLPSGANPKLNAGYRLDLSSVTWPTEPGG